MEKVIIEEADGSAYQSRKIGDYSLEFAKGGSKMDGTGDKGEGNHWAGANFYLINEAVIKEDEFLNWINENPLEVKQ